MLVRAGSPAGRAPQPAEVCAPGTQAASSKGVLAAPASRQVAEPGQVVGSLKCPRNRNCIVRQRERESGREPCVVRCKHPGLSAQPRAAAPEPVHGLQPDLRPRRCKALRGAGSPRAQGGRTSNATTSCWRVARAGPHGATRAGVSRVQTAGSPPTLEKRDTKFSRLKNTNGEALTIPAEQPGRSLLLQEAATPRK